MQITVTIPMRLVSVANMREHWATKATRAKSQRILAWAELKAADKAPRLMGPITVKVIRIAPRALDKHDNLRMACKAVVDGVADWLGVDDRDPRVTWDTGKEAGSQIKRGLRFPTSAHGHMLRLRKTLRSASVTVDLQGFRCCVSIR